jgi:hypothetical protein
MLEMRGAALVRVQDGLTTVEEAARVVQELG